MSTLSVLRMYLKIQSMPRLPIPHIGNAGILYTTSLIDRNRHVLKEDAVSSEDHPENGGALRRINRSKGSLGSFWFRRYSTTTTQEDIKKVEKERDQKKQMKLRTAETVKIMLVSETGSLSTATLEEANKIAKKKGLNLVHIENEREKPVHTEKEVYKLVSTMALLEEDEIDDHSKDVSKKQKELKTLVLKSNIAEHDLSSKVKNVQKWVDKGHRVRVMIGQAGGKGDAEAVFSKFTSKVNEFEGQIQQKITKGNEIRFYVGPPKKQKSSQKDKKSHLQKEAEDDSADNQRKG